MTPILLRFRLLVLAPVIAALGCAAQAIQVDPMLWKQTHARIGVALVSSPRAAAFKDGPQGLIDVAVNSATASDLAEHLGELNPDAFDAIAARFEQRLRDLGFATKRIEQPILLQTLPFREKTNDQFYDRDISALAVKHGVDAILLLAVERWGTIRSYYGFIPLGAPWGLCQVSGQLIERDGRLRWRVGNAGPGSTVAIEGEWDQPPTFPNVTRAVGAAQVKSAGFLEASFFKGAPSPSPLPSPRPQPRPPEARPPAASQGAPVPAAPQPPPPSS